MRHHTTPLIIFFKQFFFFIPLTEPKCIISSEIQVKGSYLLLGVKVWVICLIALPNILVTF